MAFGLLVMDYDLPHFTIYACIYLPQRVCFTPARFILFAYRIRMFSYGHHSPLINFFTFTDLHIQIPVLGAFTEQSGTKR